MRRDEGPAARRAFSCPAGEIGERMITDIIVPAGLALVGAAVMVLGFRWKRSPSPAWPVITVIAAALFTFIAGFMAWMGIACDFRDSCI